MTTRQIFSEQGFLTADGKAFVNEGFTKEVKKIFATGSSVSDILTISCILKSIVGEVAANRSLVLRTPTPTPESTKVKKESITPALTLVKSDTGAKIIPFPGNRAMREMTDLLGGLSDIPLMDVE